MRSAAMAKRGVNRSWLITFVIEMSSSITLLSDSADFLKILLGFCQTSTVLTTTYSARLPVKYTSWTESVSEVFAIDWSGLLMPAQCATRPPPQGRARPGRSGVPLLRIGASHTRRASS